MDLLLYLIEKNKINIYDIPIFEITQQYLSYLKEWESLNMEIASEFIVMAATLINIKARMLLPVEKPEEEEEDPRNALIHRLVEYRRYKAAAAEMKGMMRDESNLIICRRPEPVKGERPVPKPSELLAGISLNQLYGLYRRAVISKEDSYDTVRASFHSVEKEVYTIEEKIDSLVHMLELLEEVSFYNLKERSRSKSEAITFFQAMLELSRMNMVTLSQNGSFGDIIMKPRGEEPV